MFRMYVDPREAAPGGREGKRRRRLFDRSDDSRAGGGGWNQIRRPYRIIRRCITGGEQQITLETCGAKSQRDMPARENRDYSCFAALRGRMKSVSLSVA